MFGIEWLRNRVVIETDQPLESRSEAIASARRLKFQRDWWGASPTAFA